MWARSHGVAGKRANKNSFIELQHIRGRHLSTEEEVSRSLVNPHNSRCHLRNIPKIIMPTDTDGTTWLRWDMRSRHHHHTIAFHRVFPAFIRRRAVECQCQALSPTLGRQCRRCLVVRINTAEFSSRTVSRRVLCQRKFRTHHEPTASTVDQN